MSKKSRSRQIKWINDIIYDVLDDLLKKAGTHRAAVMWNQLVGEQIAQHTNPVGVKHKILIVEVVNPVWRQQLEFLKQEILEKLNHNLPNQKKIKKIKFILARDSGVRYWEPDKH
ncbi:MAG: hypothetical protein APR63_02565 [Desulfuromonas sp. SDB]|nr:MAG: hypothetical protein APR63_02565 [Desulfuromonas sp. SDB]